VKLKIEKRKIKFEVKQKQRMAVIKAIRCLTMAYNQSISREALRVMQARVPVISSLRKVRVPVIRFLLAE